MLFHLFPLYLWREWGRGAHQHERSSAQGHAPLIAPLNEVIHNVTSPSCAHAEARITLSPLVAPGHIGY